MENTPDKIVVNHESKGDVSEKILNRCLVHRLNDICVIFKR